MAITWKILHMDRLATSDGRNDVVKNVFWYCSDSDANGNYGYCYGNTQLSVTGISDDDFTSYSSLTEADVIQWVKDDLAASTAEVGGSNDLTIVENCVTDAISNQQYTLRHQGVPW